MTSEKEVLKALKMLQEVCEENNGRCSDCILRNASNDCGVIVDSNGDSYRALTEWDLKQYDKPRLILN